jgi:hypothetical protein
LDDNCDCEANDATCHDCAGQCDGFAEIDDCGVCSGGTANHDFNDDIDCEGVCFGSAVEDQCGVCGGDGITCLEPLPFEYNPSTSQAFYYFDTATIDGDLLQPEDWVAAFRDIDGDGIVTHGVDICVGSRQWGTSGYCDQTACEGLNEDCPDETFTDEESCMADEEENGNVWVWNGCGSGICDLPVMEDDSWGNPATYNHKCHYQGSPSYHPPLLEDHRYRYHIHSIPIRYHFLPHLPCKILRL